MSGGHFDNTYLGIAQMVGDLGEEIDRNGDGLEDEYGDLVSTNFDPATIALLIRAHSVLYRAAQIAKDVEYLYSGDHGEEVFRGLVKEELAQLERQL